MLKRPTSNLLLIIKNTISKKISETKTNLTLSHLLQTCFMSVIFWPYCWVGIYSKRRIGTHLCVWIFSHQEHPSDNGFILNFTLRVKSSSVCVIGRLQEPETFGTLEQTFKQSLDSHKKKGNYTTIATECVQWPLRDPELIKAILSFVCSAQCKL